MKNARVNVIGAGLAGSEAAYQLAIRGIDVRLIEMRPEHRSLAHETGGFAELVCSNSLGGDGPTSPAGILKQELRGAGSLIMRAADEARVPAGGALAVDRKVFSDLITNELERSPRVEIVRARADDLPDGPTIVAAGPLMRGSLAQKIREMIGADLMSFFDAAAPIVSISSIDEGASYRAGRYGQADDYVNCPMNKEEYEAFSSAVASAERAPLHEADRDGSDLPPDARSKLYFEGCLPIEVMASRGIDTLRFGPMRPVGLPDPRTGREPYAVLQLRRDDAAGTMYDLVGCQTNLKWGEQERVFRMIPALREAEFVRLGVMHRNTFVCAPLALDRSLRPARDGKAVRDDLFLAGQITGVEGYVESTASGLAVALIAASSLAGREAPAWPPETAIGSLLAYLATADPGAFQPMNVNLGIMPPLAIAGKKKKLPRRERVAAYAERSQKAFEAFWPSISI